MKILQIDSSPLNDYSVSRKLTASIVKQLQAKNPGATVTQRDLVANAPSHLSTAVLMAGQTDPSAWSEELRADIGMGETILAEVNTADVIVIGAPMYNFSVPSQLKAWIDRIAVAGKTFKYTETGPVGLLTGKKVVIASSRGGAYGENNALDHQESYLRTVLGFVGLTDVEVVRAEGVNMGEEAKAAAIASAEAKIAAL
ncbi:FMN-dependent NADH-azoreductase [Leeia sp. TBRC 13508]|uniref:FMN dependent NADH:quinone oxidoreductase n=1 Tax=Leeia speluncae TaxID=2884804 RepID=A0ABS8D1H0_9NEIS|nr:FMN-dependent NADH-azoreductase [Leeia speluncae]MCB6182030.1 FMN-dependent NADH-azoreductase [Leeia speluncae]